MLWVSALRGRSRRRDQYERDVAASTHDTTHGAHQQPIHPCVPQQTPGRFLQRGEVRHASQADGSTQCWGVMQQRDDATVVQLQAGLEDRAAKA